MSPAISPNMSASFRSRHHATLTKKKKEKYEMQSRVWTDILDCMTGINCPSSETSVGVFAEVFETAKLHRDSDSDCRWLCEVFETFGVQDAVRLYQSERNVFFMHALQTGDVRGFFVGSLFNQEPDRIWRAVEAGFAPALGYAAFLLLDVGRDEEMAALARRAAKEGERVGSWLLGKWMWGGREGSREEGIRLCRRSAEAGWVRAEWSVSLMLMEERKTDEFVSWTGKCLERTIESIESMFFALLSDAIANDDLRLLFLFGKVLRLHQSFKCSKYSKVAAIAVKHFEEGCFLARERVEVWLMVSIRLRVSKDIRRVIGILLWEQRNE